MTINRNAWRLISKVENMPPAGKRALWTGGGPHQSLPVSVVMSFINWTTLDTSGKNLYWGISSIGLACGHVCPHRHFVDCWWVWVIPPLGRWSLEVWEEQEIFSLFSASAPASRFLPRVPALAFFSGELWSGNISQMYPSLLELVLIIIFTTGLESNLGKSPISFGIWAALISHLKTKDSFLGLPEPSSIARC